MIHPLIDLGCTLRDALINHYGCPLGQRRTREHEHITTDGRHVLTITITLGNREHFIANVPLDEVEASDDRSA